MHGNHWKLVSAFIPTRTDTQVATHGRYWLKIRSPETMKKSRKVVLSSPSNTPTCTSPKKTRVTPSSVSSTSTTPRKSNKPKARATPLKGILMEKGNPNLYKNVTPRSAKRTRQMKATEGSKSDPGKRRARVQILG